MLRSLASSAKDSPSGEGALSLATASKSIMNVVVEFCAVLDGHRGRAALGGSVRKAW